MAQTPEGTTAPVQAPDRVRVPMPAGYVFQPNDRTLIESYIITKALGGVLDDPFEETVADGVDVYAVRPEALPFPRRHRRLHGHVWGYFFTTRPTGGGIGEADEGGDEDDVRYVAAGGYWRRYGKDRGYVGREGNGDGDGEVYAFRRRFAFHVAGARGKIKKTWWRMEEFRLKETAPTFRGAVFDPNAKGLVIWKVYNEVIPKEEPAVDYYGNGMNDDEEDEEEEEIGPVVITVGDAVAAALDALT